MAIFAVVVVLFVFLLFFFFFNDTATTEIYTLSLHDALPIWKANNCNGYWAASVVSTASPSGSEEHTSELQSPLNLVCRLLLEKKKKAWYGRRDLIGKEGDGGGGKSGKGG